MYRLTHLTWRQLNGDGSVSNIVHTIEDRERAADEIKELALTPGVFALRFIHEGEEPATEAAAEAAATAFHTRIGPPVTG